MSGGTRFVRACLRQPVDRTPVWFLRQAGRYMPEYQAVRRAHSLIEICKSPQLAAEVTITAAEKLDVDVAIIFADLLLPLEPLGLEFAFQYGEGPVVHRPIRTPADIAVLRTDRTADLGYVAEAIRHVEKHFAGRLGMVGFCGAPFTLASYMIEGGGSRNYIETKRLMYSDPSAWDALMQKLAIVLAEFAGQQIEAGADVIQLFDSWAGALSVSDYREYVLPITTSLVHQVQAQGCRLSTLVSIRQRCCLRCAKSARMSSDWTGGFLWMWAGGLWEKVAQCRAISILSRLFAPQAVLRKRVEEVLRQAGGVPGHIFNVGHGIVPGTPVENVQQVVRWVREICAQMRAEQT